MKTVKLSARMQALADMVSKDRVVCDVGCDHGFVSIYLVQEKIATKVYAMDVRTGPLERAKEHIAEYHLETYIETRLSDGLEKLQVGEADCMLCAGMGGPLMSRILMQGREKARSMKELILQPQSEIALFRKFLREEGYKIIQENMIYEDGKYYPMMKVIPVECFESGHAATQEEQELWDAYGELLLKEKNPVLKQYLAHSEAYIQNLLKHLQSKGGNEERVVELEKELGILQKARAYVEDFSSGTVVEE
ncbi:MAG: SAM-dependent methyltransferase [Lachnospiraceae bacterium]|nr:SAM-dependent methyltransferase [Lachnospiraceae bacterium]